MKPLASESHRLSVTELGFEPRSAGSSIQAPENKWEKGSARGLVWAPE